MKIVEDIDGREEVRIFTWKTTQSGREISVKITVYGMAMAEVSQDCNGENMIMIMVPAPVALAMIEAFEKEMSNGE